MIAEPYICIKGPPIGEIISLDSADIAPEQRSHHLYLVHISRGMKDLAENLDGSEQWQPYADFEREKLKELRGGMIFLDAVAGYSINTRRKGFLSKHLVSYSTHDFAEDSESSRLLKRAEFLKAVCEKEGVEWLANVEHVCAHDWERTNRQRNTGMGMMRVWVCKKCSDYYLCEEGQTPGPDCHCGKDGHPLGSINCPVHGRNRLHPEQVEWQGMTHAPMYKPERDVYSKAEIDERMDSLLSQITNVRCMAIQAAVRSFEFVMQINDIAQKAAIEFRKRFLS